jgi:GTP-binding protein
MVPCDAENIREEYEVLLRELTLYNEELLHKPRLLAITKSDLIDDELKELLQAELPDDLPVLFISSVAQMGLQELKDKLWEMMNEGAEEENES